MFQFLLKSEQNKLTLPIKTCKRFCAYLENEGNIPVHYDMKAYGGVDVYIHVFLTSALVGGEWSDSSSGRFTLGETAPVPIWQEAGWTPEPVWTARRREYSCPYRNSNSDP
jgi:hypothetical protein